MASKQTAVEWLVEQIFNDVDLKDGILKLAIQQAKAMEKEQIVETYNEGALDGLQLGEQYYNFTYNS
jgi:hypothetical protein